MTLFDYSTKSIRLDPLSADHTADIHVYAAKPHVKLYIGWPLMSTRTETGQQVQLFVQRHAAGSHVYCSVVEQSSGRVVGTGIIFNFDKAAGHAEIGYVLDDSVWGKGYGTQLVSMLSHYALEDLGLRKLYARVVDENVGSARVLVKNGYALEAELKDFYRIDGRLMNCHIYSRYVNGLKTAAPHL